MIGSQNLLFSYFTCQFYSENLRGGNYWIASQFRAPQNQTRSPAWSMGQGEGEFVFLPDWLFLIIYVRRPTSCFWLYRVMTEIILTCILHVCERSVCILMLPVRTVLHTPWWWSVWVPWSWSMSLTLPDKRCREKQSVKVSACRIYRYSETLNYQGIQEKFYGFFFFFFLCLGLYNFPVFIWYGLVRRILRPPRKGTLLGSLFLFNTRVETAMLLDIRILYQK